MVNYVASIITSILMLVCGVLLMVNPFGGALAITQVLGIFMLVYAVLDIYNAIMIRKEVKETVKATVKTAAKKTAQKKTTRKTTTKKEASSTEVFVEFYGQQSSVESVEERVKAAFVAEGHKAGTIKSLKIYLKPEEQAAYYAINDKFAGRVDLF